MPFSVEQFVHNWNQGEPKISAKGWMLKEIGSLACFNILCQVLQVLCGVFDAGCRNSVLFLAVLKCL